MGRLVTPETRAKISASLMGHSVSATTGAKISAANTGKHWKLSAETKQRQSDARCARPRRPIGSRSLHKTGYVLVKIAQPSVWVFEHRLVAEQALGRSLRRGEEPHHKDLDKTNNVPSNIEVLTVSKHRQLHWDMRKASR